MGRGCCRNGHYVVVPALEDCTPDLPRGVVAVCRWGREVVVWGAEAGGAEGGVAGWCGGLFLLFSWFGSAGWSFSAGARRRRVVPRCVTLGSVLCVRAWPHSMAGIQTCWPWAYWRARQSTRSTRASWRLLPGVARSSRALIVSLIQLSCSRYQPRRVFRALPWRVARRRSGSRMVVGVSGGVLWVQGGLGRVS